MNYKSFDLGDWIGHISGVLEDESELDGNEMRDLVEFLSRLPKWISVSERLPNRDEYIASNGLFIVSDGNRSYAEYFDMYNSQKYFGEPTMEGFKVDRCVTKWMPLPPCNALQKSEGV